MTPMRVTLALMVVMVAVLLAAGCTGGQPATDNRAVNATATTPATIATTIPVSISPDLSQCPIKDNRTFSVTKGDSFSYIGISPNINATVVNVWIFGKEYANFDSVSVKPDRSFIFTLNNSQEKEMKPGTYRIIFQYPRAGDTFDISIKNEYRLDVNDKQGRLLFNINRIRENEIDGFEAANIFEREIMKPGIGDTIFNITLVMEKPWIRIAPIGDHIIGDNFSLNGTTNFGSGRFIRVTVYKSVCSCIPIGQIEIYGENPIVFEQDVKAIPGSCDENIWSVSVNTSKYRENEYLAFVSAENEEVTCYSLFNVFEIPVSTSTTNSLPNETTNPVTR